MTPATLRRAPGHPLALAAGALMLANDLVFRPAFPGFVTGKLSDVGFLVVFPVVLAALLSPFRRARGLALGITLVFYTTLQLWPPLGFWFSPAHVADVGDLLVLPAILLAPLCWRAAGSSRVWALPALVGVLVADTFAPTVDRTWPCGDGQTWDPATPLAFMLDSFGELPLNDDFVQNVHLHEPGGDDLAVIVVADDYQYRVCARDGLEANTDYVWQLGPWSGASSNQITLQHHALPTVRFRTGPGQGSPITSTAECERAVARSRIPAAIDEACGPPRDTGSDTGADSGFDTGADTGEAG